MEAIFTKVPQDWPRRPYFDYYFYKIKSKYNINHHIDITEFLKAIREQGLKFYPSFIYVVIHTVNQHEEFRMSLDAEGNLGSWNYVVPSYTIFHKDDATFSDLWSHYTPDFKTFYANVVSDMAKYKDVRGIKARPNQPANFCPISVLPWLSFHSVSQDTYSEGNLLFPIIRFGKYYEENGRYKLPLSIFVNHAIADGFHSSMLINDIEALGRNVKMWLK